VADRTTADTVYGQQLDLMARVVAAGLIAHQPNCEVWRPLAVATADNDLEGVLGSLPRVLAAAGLLTNLRELPNYTIARELAMVCDVAADLGLLVRLRAIERS